MDVNELSSTFTNTWDGRSLIKLLNMLFLNSLTTESPRAPQPLDIKVPLRPHQLAVINHMETLEKESIVGREYKSFKTFSNFGFVGDEVGTGKSLMILSHISRMKHNDRVIETNTLTPPRPPSPHHQHHTPHRKAQIQRSSSK